MPSVMKLFGTEEFAVFQSKENLESYGDFQPSARQRSKCGENIPSREESGDSGVTLNGSEIEVREASVSPAHISEDGLSGGDAE
jgi:hypothetical protein